MNSKVSVIARTVESNNNLIKENVSFEPDAMVEDSIILSGKAAGICYMPDDYLSNGIQNAEVSYKRAGFNSKSGHYSVFEHSHFTFLIETSKMMAMILNSTKLYATSEKSGRYTSMNPETELEKEMYEKWSVIFEGLIREKTTGYTDKEIHKLALENARYTLSVFTPTVMMFTVPFSRVILLCEWLDNLSDNIRQMIKDDFDKYLYDNNDEYLKNAHNTFYLRVANECEDLAEQFRKSLNLDKNNPILKDHKDIGIDFFNTVSYYRRQDFINSVLDIKEEKDVIKADDFLHDDFYGITNRYSFACLAQEQRHRTIDYKILDILFNEFYIPEILKDTDLVNIWIDDLVNLTDSGVITQATMCSIKETGLISNFYLKCKERLCMRAQLEISNTTKEQIESFFNMIHEGRGDLDRLNKARILSMMNINDKDNPIVLPRCAWKNYKCNEPCKHVSKNCLMNRII